MKEDYVSFETAKLLKEKEFVGENEIGCRCGFYKQNEEYPSQINLVYDDLNNSELEYNECLRFTHQMAMKWLREKYKLNIIISVDDLDWFYSIIDYTHKSDVKLLKDLAGFNSYESACESAIKYCLTNLI